MELLHDSFMHCFLSLLEISEAALVSLSDLCLYKRGKMERDCLSVDSLCLCLSRGEQFCPTQTMSLFRRTTNRI